MTLSLDKLYLESRLFFKVTAAAVQKVDYALLYRPSRCVVLALGFESVCFSHSRYVWLPKQTSHRRPPLVSHQLHETVPERTSVQAAPHA